MLRRCSFLLITLALGLLVAPLAAEAPPAGKVARMGYLAPGTATTSAGRQAFTEGLRQHGWIEGQNLTIEYRWAEGRYERLPDLAAELAQLPLDAIFAMNTPTALAMQRTGTTRPVVFAIVSEPVEIGLVESLPRPGRNFTGLTTINRELMAKRWNAQGALPV
jgi:putative ABC transport system substrate-binding protein